MNIISIIDDFKKNNSMLWVEDNGIKLFVSEDFKSEELKKTITEFKTEIFNILVFNGIYSKIDFLNKLIFKTDTQESILSFAQERLWFIEQYEEGTNAYHMPFLYELDEETDKEGLKYALQQIVSRHEVLRSTIEPRKDEGHGMQIVHNSPLFIEEIIVDETDDYNSLINETINRPFNLNTEYPIRVVFYTIKSSSEVLQSKTLLLITIHHIASDGWSLKIFESELFDYYEAYVKKDIDFSLPALDIQYKDYAQWQRSYLTGSVLEDQLSYWKGKLSGYELLEFPTDYARPATIDYKGEDYDFKINSEITERLRALAQREGLTLNNVMLSSINIMLGKYTGQDDIVIGTLNANRQQIQTENLIGFFVNTQANRTILNNSQNFVELIQEVQRDQIEAQLNQDLPFEKIVNDLGIDRHASRHPIFQILFEMDSFGKEEKKTEDQKKYLKSYNTDEAYINARFDIVISINNHGDEMLGEINFANSLFNKETITRFSKHYLHLLDELTQAPNKAYSQISLLNPEDHKKIVYDYNATDETYPKNKSIIDLFEEQVKKTPNNIAIVFGEKELTYKELEDQSNKLAHYLIKNHNIQDNDLIGIMLDKSEKMLISIFGVLKAGAAYVCIDSEYPTARKEFIVQDASLNVLITQTDYIFDLDYYTGNIIAIDVQLDDIDSSIEFIKKDIKQDNLAYVIYTSGTTGKPKGVMVEHGAVLSLVFNNYINLSDNEVFAFLSSPSFDASTFEIFTPLLSGHKLIVPTDFSSIVSSATKFKTFLELNKISILWLTKTLFDNLYYLDNKLFSDLEYLIIGGEALDKNAVNKLISSSSKPKHFLNGYGPTESTTFTCTYDMVNEIEGQTVPIGKPINNRSVYVLDLNMCPVPVGVIGELYIGGAGLSRGYLNRPELTAERFIDNPFATDTDRENGYTQLYKTGDLVRWLANETLEYIGRGDNQVKIRGYRIELGEIEHAMSQIEGIMQVSVQARDKVIESGSSKYLVGYYILNEDGVGLTVDAIERSLSGILPDYMIPSAFVEMDSFPLTANGKLNKRLFTDPDFNSSDSDYVEPTTYEEIEVCKIWSDLLGLDRVGITDDFFKIGGNSILAIQVSHRTSKILGKDVKVADVFKYKTITQLLVHVINQSQIIIPKIDADQIGLSFAQERLWFIEQFEEGTNAYHIPVLYKLDATANKEGLKYALQQVVTRHEILRSTIEQEENDKFAIQKVNKAPLSILEITSSETDDYELLITEEINRPFNLSNEYPIRVNFYTIKSETDASLNKTILLINIHHIATDGWSKEIFEKEVLAYYDAYLVNNKAFKLPELEIQYKDYALWQRDYLTGDILEKQLGYWKEKLTGYQTLEFPTDYARPSVVNYRGASQEFLLNKELSKKLRDLAQREGVTLNSLLLSSVTILLGKYTGQNDIVIGTAIANRHHRQTESLIGFFVNMQANRTILNSSQSFEDLIQETHKDQINAQMHQDLPFEKLIDELGVERDASRHPVFQVMFGVLSFGSGNDGFEYNDAAPFRPYDFEDVHEVAKYDLSIFIDDSKEELLGEISYATSLFTKESIARLANHYIYLLNELTENSSRFHNEISLLNSGEYQQIIHDWNAAEETYPKNKSIIDLFEEQVKKTPNNIAIVFGEKELTYKELDDQSNKLAYYLINNYNIQDNDLIGIMLDKSEKMLVSIFGVLKAGAAYVCIDSEYPTARKEFIVQDASLNVLITQTDYIFDLDYYTGSIIAIDIQLDDIDDSVAFIKKDIKQDNLAYVIYTSGTTGTPKGVMVEHGAVLSLVFNNYINLADNEVFAFLSSPSFDASTFEIFAPLLSGHKLIVPTDFKSIVSGATKFKTFLELNKISILWLTKTLFDNLYYLDNTLFSDLEYLIIGGEVLDKNIVNKLISSSSKPKHFLNAYGPTESTTFACTYDMMNEIESQTVPIGKPINNRSFYVLDLNRRPVPVGVIGELYIGGAGLSRGYLNRPELTAERFIDNLFATDIDRENGHARLYKTGDLVRWSVNETLEYIGRVDNQVKIRGYRIELGEIEQAMSQIEGIMQVSVQVRERVIESGSSKYLVGYYILNGDGSGLTVAAIERSLSGILPDYMIPSAFVEMDSFPLTANGKLNKSLFADPDFNSSDSNYVEPTTYEEKEACKIWSDLLGLDRVGITDDFFKIGGNSILAIQVSHRMSKILAKDVKVADIFKHKTINNLKDISVNSFSFESIEGEDWEISL